MGWKAGEVKVLEGWRIVVRARLADWQVRGVFFLGGGWLFPLWFRVGQR